MPGMTHQPPEATENIGEGGSSGNAVVWQWLVCLKQRGVSIRTFSLRLFRPLSHTTRLSLVMRGSPDTRRIPFDKLRPLGSKIAVVGTELWHTAANQVPGLLTLFVTSHWSPLQHPLGVSPLPTSSLLCLPPGSGLVSLWVKELLQKLPEFFHKLTSGPCQGMWGAANF